MGFFKKETTKITQNVCGKCDSSDIEFIKIIGYGEKEGVVYHYMIKCHSCRKAQFIPRTQEVYEKVKDIPWRKTKAYKKYELSL